MAYRKIPTLFTMRSTLTTPQPALGSWITAIVTGSLTGPQYAPITLTLGNAASTGNDAAIFIKGEPAWLIDPNGANAENVMITNVSGNNVTLGNMTDMSAQGGQNPVTRNSHVAGALGVGTWIMPKQMANNYVVTFEDGATGNFLYIGNSWLMNATQYRIWKLAKAALNVQPAYYSSAMFSPGNPFDMSEIWVFGTTGDQWDMSVAID